MVKQTVAFPPVLSSESHLTCDERADGLNASSSDAYFTPQLRALLVASRPSNDALGADVAQSGAQPGAVAPSGEHRSAPQLHALLASAPPPLVASGPAVRPSASARWPGFEAGPYRLTRRLGGGTVGTVWVAQQQGDHGPERVAIKFGYAQAEGSERLGPAERFRKAQPLMAALAHPNIARVYDATRDGAGLPYLVMQYVAGRPLLEYCRLAQPSITRRVRLAYQAAQALAHAHAQDIVHGNLKPNNLLVTAQGTLRLLDLGSEQLLGPAPLHARVSPHAAPEQLCGAAPDFAGDVYALGALFYEALCGARPYSVPPGSTRALREAASTQKPAAPSSRLLDAAALPPELDALILRCLSKQPDERPSARGLARELRALLSGPLSERRPPPRKG